MGRSNNYPAVTLRLAQAVRKHRKRLGITKTELGELLDCTRTNIGQIERGTHCPNLEKALILSLELGFSLDDVARAAFPSRGKR